MFLERLFGHFRAAQRVLAAFFKQISRHSASGELFFDTFRPQSEVLGRNSLFRELFFFNGGAACFGNYHLGASGRYGMCGATLFWKLFFRHCTAARPVFTATSLGTFQAAQVHFLGSQ